MILFLIWLNLWTALLLRSRISIFCGAITQNQSLQIFNSNSFRLNPSSSLHFHPLWLWCWRRSNLPTLSMCCAASCRISLSPVLISTPPPIFRSLGLEWTWCLRRPLQRWEPMEHPPVFRTPDSFAVVISSVFSQPPSHGSVYYSWFVCFSSTSMLLPVYSISFVFHRLPSLSCLPSPRSCSPIPGGCWFFLGLHSSLPS